jgi:glutaredoxin
MAQVILYSRPGCHLCDEARTMLESERVSYEEIDIDRDDALIKRYLERIPVISIDGDEAFELVIDAVALGQRLASVKHGTDADQR